MWTRGLLSIAAGVRPSALPAAICWPESAEEIQALVRLAKTHRIALVPFGAGSGVAGGVGVEGEERGSFGVLGAVVGARHRVDREVAAAQVVLERHVGRRVEREAVVAQFASRFRECSLLALRAEPGFGKTQLARLLVLPMPMVWVRLRRSSSDVDRIIADAKEYAVANEKSVVVLDNIGSIGSDDAAIDELLSAIDGEIGRAHV